MNNQIICPRCTFDRNPETATKCQICNTPLQPNASASTDSVGKPIWLDGKRLRTFTRSNVRQIKAARKKPKFIASGIAIAILLAVGIIIGSIWQGRNASNVSTGQKADNETSSNRGLSQSNASSGSKTEESVEFNPKSANKFVAADKVPNGRFWYGSSIPFSPMHTPEITSEIEEALPQFKTVYKEAPAYTKPGSSTSVAMLLDGTVSFAELSRPLKESEYKKATARGFTLKQIPIASDGIVFFVNSTLPVDKLTIEQVRKMILGKITNWQQVGGPDLPVVPFVFDPKVAPSTLLLLFEKPELEQFSNAAQYVRDYTDAIRKVSSTPGGISYASAAIIANQRSVSPLSLARGNSKDYINPFTQERKINTEALQNGDYPLLRRFFIGIREDGTIDERVGKAYANIWLSQSGQELIEQAGFVPIKSF